MRVVWNRGQLSIIMTVDDAKLLLKWLQKFGPMVPDSVQLRLKTRLEDSFPDWSKFCKS